MKTYHGAQDEGSRMPQSRALFDFIDLVEVARGLRLFRLERPGLMTGANVDFDQTIVGVGDPPLEPQGKAIDVHAPRVANFHALTRNRCSCPSQPSTSSRSAVPRSTSTANRLAGGYEDMAFSLEGEWAAARPILRSARRGIRLEERPHSPASATSIWGAISAIAMGARRRRCRRRSYRPASPDLAGHPRHSRRQDVSAHLLSRQLRRQRTRRGGHRRSLHREREGDRRYGHAFFRGPKWRRRKIAPSTCAQSTAARVVFDVDYRPNFRGLGGPRRL